MYNFTFHRPTTVRQAAGLLARIPEAKLLAGGHSLLPVMKQRLAQPSALIDLSLVEGLSGVEDTRQAIIEARGQGVYPFCLTIDRQGQEYLGRIFGEAGHTVLRNPQELPMALVKVVRHLLAS